MYVQAPSSILFSIAFVLLADSFLFSDRWLLTRKAWRGGLALSRAPVKSYKAKVASLTSERADLRAQIRDLTEELVKHRSDLKHASTTRA